MIKCAKCGQEHNIDDDTYITVHGNMYIGKNGGVVGNNFPQGKDQDGEFTYCRINCVEKDVPFGPDDVQKTYFCIGCYLKDIQNWFDECVKRKIDEQNLFMERIKGKEN